MLAGLEISGIYDAELSTCVLVIVVSTEGDNSQSLRVAANR